MNWFCQNALVSTFSPEFSFSVFSPGDLSHAVTQKPSLLPYKVQTDVIQTTKPELPEDLPNLTVSPHLKPDMVSQHKESFSHTMQTKSAPLKSEPQKHSKKGQRDDVVTGHSLEVGAESSVVPWPLPTNTNSSSMESDLKHKNTHADTEIHDENETSTHANASLDAQAGKETKTLSKDKKLQEEERLLLAKIRQMSGDSSPDAAPRGMKRLVPAPGDIDADITESKSQSDSPSEPTDDDNHSNINSVDAFQEVSLTETEETWTVEDV